MGFRQFLYESSILKEEKIFILIIGGSASGKNTIHSKHFSKIDLVDVDKYTYELSGGDLEKARSKTAKAISMANQELEKHYQQGKSVAQVSTGSNVKGVFNKLEKAKSYGFKTALVLVDTDVDTAIERNRARADAGKQALIPDWKVEKTNIESRKTFNALKNDVDYSLKLKG